jgi:hypothetical protein
MAIGDVWELRLLWEASAQVCSNVFHYLQESNPSSGTAVAALSGAFEADVLPALLAIVSSSVVSPGAVIINLNDPDQYLEESWDGGPLAGSRSGQPLANVNNWSFKSPRLNPTQAPGYKRFVGVSESDISTHVTASAMSTLMDNVEIALSDPCSILSADFQMVIAERPIVLGTNPAYRLAENWVYLGLGTQISRKRPLIASFA